MLVAVATGGVVALADDRAVVRRRPRRRGRASLAASLWRSSLSFRGEPVPFGPWRDYVTLTKPRIMSPAAPDRGCRDVRRRGRVARRLGLLVATMAGLALACGGSSALNHVMDADIDKLMGERTAARPSPRAVSPRRARSSSASSSGPLVRAARHDRERAHGRARARRRTLLRRRLHRLPEALDRPEHRHRRRRRGGAAASSATPPRRADLTLPALWLFLIVFLWTPPHFWALALMIKEHYASGERADAARARRASARRRARSSSTRS